MSHVLLVIGLAIAFPGASASAQPSLAVIALDFVRTDRVRSEIHHDILPLALFDGTQIQRLSQPFVVPGRGRRMGSVQVSEVDVQTFHCTGSVVGTGEFVAREPLPQSDMKDSIRAWLAGETAEYKTQAYIAISRTESAAPFDGDTIVTLIEDREALRHYADDVLALEPRANESTALRLFRLGPSGSAAEVFSDELHGC